MGNRNSISLRVISNVRADGVKNIDFSLFKPFQE
jgi:hypothetical protein